MDSDRQPPSLVGRTRELGAIDLALDRVSSGAQWAIEVVGEPGIGKSRLLAEVCRRASERGFLVLDGRAAEFEQDIPFGVFIDALNDHVGSLGPTTIRALDADAVEELSSVLPSMSALGDERVVGGGDARRYRVHYAIRALLERLAKSQPLLLALDDVHWADAASFEVIAHLLRRFRGRLLIALAFRHAPAHLIAALEATARAGSGSRLELAPMTRDEARALLDPELDARDREAVYLESGGNPFYLEQLARDRARQPSSSSLVTGDGWVAPPSVIASIEHELDLLPPDCRVALDAAAVAGESFDPGLVAAIAEQDERAALAALDELLAADLIRSTAVPQRFRFRHPIVRRVVYEAMPAGWRLGAHARAATALAVVHASKAERAHHVARSATVGDEQAIALLVEAARDAALRAPLTGGRLLLAAVRLIPGDADGRRVRLLGDAGALLTSGGGYSEALDALEEALSLTSGGQIAVRGDLIAKLAEARRRGGRPFASRADLEHTTESLTGADDSIALAVRLELAMDRYWHGDFERVRELAAEVLDVAGGQHDQLLVCLAASLKSLAYSYECEIEAALAELQEAQAAFAALPDERLAARIYLTHYISEAALRLERADDALAHVRRGLDVARMTGQDATSRSWHGIAVYALMLKGRLPDAESVAEDAIDLAAAYADDWRMSWLLSADSLAAFWRGRTDRALASAKEALTRSKRAHAGTVMPRLARVELAGALFASGDPGSCRDELRALDADGSRWLLDLNSAHGWVLLVRAQLALGELDAAADAAARAETRAAALSQRSAAARWASAAVMLAAGDVAAASSAAREALRLAESSGNPLSIGRCRGLLGSAFVAGGESDRGIAELQQAEQSLSGCGAAREADAVARELRRLGQRVARRARPDRGAGLTQLSPREREVADEVAAGKTNRDIAATLFLSEKTVESHLSRIYSKLDVHSRAALTAIVARAPDSSHPTTVS